MAIGEGVRYHVYTHRGSYAAGIDCALKKCVYLLLHKVNRGKQSCAVATTTHESI